MKTLWFEGSSDDTFGMTQTQTADDYDNCADGKPIDWLITVPGVPCGVVISGQYGRNAPTGRNRHGRPEVVPLGWSIGVAAYDLDVETETPIPEWPMRFERGERPYSPRLVIEVPDDAIVQCITRGDTWRVNNEET